MNIFQILKRWLPVAGVFAACTMPAQAGGFFGSDIKSDNIYVSASNLPPTLRRVAVLPLAHEESQQELTSGCEMFEQVLQSELIKTKRFEVVSVGARELNYTTGQRSWTGAEDLPANFFDTLRKAHDCDAVLFCQLTTYQPYAPLVTGWRMKLVDVSTQRIIWAADMVFDANDAAVRKDAQKFQKEQQGENGERKSKKALQSLTSWIYHEPAPVTEEQWEVLNSPRYFGQFSLAKLLKTLPQR